MDKALQNLLNESFDRELTAREQEELRLALENDVSLRKEEQRLRKLRSLFKDSQASFGPFFAHKVMHRLETQSEKAYNLAFMRIAMPGLIAAIILLLITFIWGNGFSLDALMGVETLQPEYLADFLFYNY